MIEIVNKCRKKRKLVYRIPINKSGRNDGNRKSPLGKHHNNSCRQESSTDVKSSGQVYVRNQFQKISPQKMLITKRIYHLRNLADIIFTN